MNIGDTAGEDNARRDLATYLAAYARLRQSLLVADNKVLARSYLEDCITGLKALLERRADDAQARALLGSCYGASSRYHFLGAAWRGLEAGRQIATAVEQAPDNAWVVFQDGVSDYETPMMFGGSKKRAIGKLRRAAVLFAASRSPGFRAAGLGRSRDLAVYRSHTSGPGRKRSCTRGAADRRWPWRPTAAIFAKRWKRCLSTSLQRQSDRRETPRTSAMPGCRHPLYNLQYIYPGYRER